MVQSGGLSYTGISSTGNCKDKGYKISMELGNIANDLRDLQTAFGGACRGMTAQKFSSS